MDEKEGQISLSTHFVTILSPVSFFTCAILLWEEMKACIFGFAVITDQ
jgi:hypothetical protein